MIRRFAYWSAVALRRIAHALESFSASQTTLIRKAMSGYDMVAEPDELYYRDQYWHWLRPELERCFPNRAARALDVGCGQGRLALPLAEWLTRGSVVGVDITPAAVERAQRYASEYGLRNAEFHAGDALEFVRALPPASLDVALMLEVAFFMPAYREVIAAIARALKPSGLFGVSFRSQYFDLLHSVYTQNWVSAQLVRDAREGHWGGGSTWFSWHTSADIRSLLTIAGFNITGLRGIGIASGIEGDPLALIARPSTLGPTDYAQLMGLEISLAEQYADCGRYILATAIKMR
jgi:2-polyprenyl-3-methyl-5-hydroxy-6-metoxy-1,4-benzoquinol methylase